MDNNNIQPEPPSLLRPPHAAQRPREPLVRRTRDPSPLQEREQARPLHLIIQPRLGPSIGRKSSV